MASVASGSGHSGTSYHGSPRHGPVYVSPSSSYTQGQHQPCSATLRVMDLTHEKMKYKIFHIILKKFMWNFFISWSNCIFSSIFWRFKLYYCHCPGWMGIKLYSLWIKSEASFLWRYYYILETAKSNDLTSGLIIRTKEMRFCVQSPECYWVPEQIWY